METSHWAIIISIISLSLSLYYWIARIKERYFPVRFALTELWEVENTFEPRQFGLIINVLNISDKPISIILSHLDVPPDLKKSKMDPNKIFRCCIQREDEASFPPTGMSFLQEYVKIPTTINLESGKIEKCYAFLESETLSKQKEVEIHYSIRGKSKKKKLRAYTYESGFC